MTRRIPSLPRFRLTRRNLFSASLGAGLGGLFFSRRIQPVGAAATISAPKHLVWVWQFSNDAEPNEIALSLRDYDLGIVLKTHDGLQWMSEYDLSPFSVSGPSQVRVLANYFKSAGVPFHAWTVVHGSDPIKEARMAADVLAAGAQSIHLDVEPHSGFWRGSDADAVAFGRELRRLQPDAPVVLSIDARPWFIDAIPLKEFAAFSDVVAPQLYWRTFDNSANYKKFAESGFPVPAGGMTPEFLQEVSRAVLSDLELKVVPVGQGAASDQDEWRSFVEGAFADGNEFVSVWRYGVTAGEILSLLRDLPPPLPRVASHVVQHGDTLGGIAEIYGSSVEELSLINGLSDPNYIFVGQEIALPGGSIAQPAALQTPGSGQQYEVQDGDTLYGIAGRFGTSADSIAKLNALENPNFIYIGQVLQIP